MKIARLIGTRGEVARMLYEVHILWMNEQRMALTGFERVQEGGKIVDYAQSWICLLGADADRGR